MQPQIQKIILLGDTSTGKSSFLKNYMSNARTKASIPTVNFECLTALNSKPQKYLQIWDTPGRQKYRLFPMSMIDKFAYALIFYDISNKHTFQVCKDIVQKARIYNPMIKIAIIGNKLDLVTINPLKREVPNQQAHSFAKKRGAMFEQYSFQQRADRLLQRFFEVRRFNFKNPQTNTVNAYDFTAQLKQ